VQLYLHCITPARTKTMRSFGQSRMDYPLAASQPIRTGLILHTTLTIAKLATFQNSPPSATHCLHSSHGTCSVYTHTTQHSKPGSSDGIVTRLRPGRCKFRCLARAGIFCLPGNSLPCMGPTEPSIQRHQRLSPSCPFRDEANKEWRCTSIPRYTDNFTFGFLHFAISL
jgi:hypothetical protein